MNLFFFLILASGMPCYLRSIWRPTFLRHGCFESCLAAALGAIAFDFATVADVRRSACRKHSSILPSPSAPSFLTEKSAPTGGRLHLFGPVTFDCPSAVTWALTNNGLTVGSGSTLSAGWEVHFQLKTKCVWQSCINKSSINKGQIFVFHRRLCCCFSFELRQKL